MNNNLPMKKQEGFWTKFKNIFLGMFSNSKSSTINEQQSQQVQEVQNNTLRDNRANSNFRTELSSEYNKKQYLYELRRKYEEDPNFVKSMSDEEIKALTDLYNEETAEIYRQIKYKKV